MNETLKMVLSLSVSGTFVLFLLLLVRPLLKERLSKCWQYYIWLVVVARLLLPFTPEASLVGTVFQWADTRMEQVNAAALPEQGITAAPPTDTPKNKFAAEGQGTSENAEPSRPAAEPTQKVQTMLWVIWVGIALILFIRKITVYQSFVKFIRAGCIEVADIGKLEQFGKIMERSKIRGTAELCTNTLVATPLMIGFFRPCIVLPATDLSDLDFEYTVLHELTHYKRGDMFYKWLVQLAVCLHWFNPFVYLMSREISRACELACDEAVIKKLDTKGQREYGDTLLNSIGVGGNYKESLASVTLNESKELLKERLEAIMNFKKSSKLVISITLSLTMLFCIGAIMVGAYGLTPLNPISKVQTPEAVEAKTGEHKVIDSLNDKYNIISDGDGVYYMFINGATQSDKPSVSVSPGNIYIVLVDKNEYTTLGPFERSDELAEDIIKQCEVMLSKKQITQDNVDLLLQKAYLFEEIERALAQSSLYRE